MLIDYTDTGVPDVSEGNGPYVPFDAAAQGFGALGIAVHGNANPATWPAPEFRLTVRTLSNGTAEVLSRSGTAFGLALNWP